jgi:hypothetical protein
LGGCAATGCFANCLKQATQAMQAGGGACAAKFNFMLQCAATESACDCENAANDYHACIDHLGSETISCGSEYGGGGPGYCEIKSTCGTHTLAMQCKNGASTVECSCLVNGSLTGTCEVDAALISQACDLTYGCCVPFFPAN